MKNRVTAFMAGLVALFGMSSCLEVDQAINLKKDGSGTITEEVVMGAQMIAMLEGGLGGLGGEAGANPLEQLYDEAKYKTEAGNYGEGVKYSKLEKIERNGGKGVKVTYTFEDINKVKFSPGSAMDDVGGGGEAVEVDAGPEEPLTFAYADGVLTINFPDLPGEAAKEGEGDAPDLGLPANDPASEAMMMQMFKDMKVAARINILGGIAETDASNVKDDTITLMEMNFAEIVKNPEGLKALQKMENGNRADLQNALKGVQGVKLETKPKVQVKLK